MSHEPQTARRSVEITNPLGLHLRPANLFARLANSFTGTEIRIFHEGRHFNGKSILELAMLAAECGTRLELEAEGPAAEEALAALADLVASQFDENEPPAPVEGQAS